MFRLQSSLRRAHQHR